MNWQRDGMEKLHGVMCRKYRNGERTKLYPVLEHVEARLVQESPRNLWKAQIKGRCGWKTVHRAPSADEGLEAILVEVADQ